MDKEHDVVNLSVLLGSPIVFRSLFPAQIRTSESERNLSERDNVSCIRPRRLAAGRCRHGAGPGLASARGGAQQLGVHLAASLQLDASGTGLLRWLAVIAAIYLLILDRTNWRTNLLTALLVPYLALQLPEPIFGYLRGGIGAWIAFIAVVIRLFFAQKFPQLINGDLELPVAFILLIVTAPVMIVHIRGHTISDIVCLLIGAYLLFEHTNHAGGFRRAFAESQGVPHTIGILLLFVAPAWAFFKHVF